MARRWPHCKSLRSERWIWSPTLSPIWGPGSYLVDTLQKNWKTSTKYCSFCSEKGFTSTILRGGTSGAFRWSDQTCVLLPYFLFGVGMNIKHVAKSIGHNSLSIYVSSHVYLSLRIFSPFPKRPPKDIDCIQAFVWAMDIDGSDDDFLLDLLTCHRPVLWFQIFFF